VKRRRRKKLRLKVEPHARLSKLQRALLGWLGKGILAWDQCAATGVGRAGLLRGARTSCRL
jgi:hypothetical protein